MLSNITGQKSFNKIIIEMRCTIQMSFKIYHIEAVAQACPIKMVFLKISQNSQENTCRVSILIML